MNSSRPYLIRALYEWIMDNKEIPHILVNTTYPGVNVPSGFDKNGQIVFNISGSAVQRLRLDNEGVAFRGRFKGEEHNVYVPTQAIMSMYAKGSGQGMMFESPEYVEIDVPPVKQDRSRPTGRPNLKLVK